MEVGVIRMISYLKFLLKEYKEKLENKQISITEKEIFSIEVIKGFDDDKKIEKEIKTYMNEFNFKYIRTHKNLEVNLGYVRENQKFRKYFANLFESKQSTNTVKYEILEFRYNFKK